MSRYDIEKFDPAPDPDLVCCICQCVLDRAVECPCRHVFCQGCIERWLTNRHTCPTCRKRTLKQDLQPVLPLVQNMLNRLLMICDYRDNGCLEKIMLENYEAHVRDCGYEIKTCRFIKCGEKILKMNLDQHETVDCGHRESLCGGECGLMIALSDRPTHVCMEALKAHIDEKNRMIDTLKTKLHELNNLSQSLNDQLEQLRQQLDNNGTRLGDSLSSFSGSDTDVTEFMSDQESFFDDSNDSFANQLSDNNAGEPVTDAALENYPNGNESDVIDSYNAEPVNDVMEQVEVTVVHSLFDLSSRLERVRDEMRTVLNSGTGTDNNNLTEEIGMRSARIDDIIDNMSRSINDSSVRASITDSQRNASRDVQSSNSRSVSVDNAVDENENVHEILSRSADEVNNNTSNNSNPTDYEPQSDHSYSAYRPHWESPGGYSERSVGSLQHSERSPSHSYRSDIDQRSVTDHSYSATPDRNSFRSSSTRSRSPSSFRMFSDRDSRCSSPGGMRSNTPRSLSRSPSPSYHSNRFSSDVSYHSSPVSTYRSPSVQSGGSYRSDHRSISDCSATPRSFRSPRSTGTLSPRSPLSTDHWNSDHNGDSGGSRHSDGNWSYRSRQSYDDWSNRSRSSALQSGEGHSPDRRHYSDSDNDRVSRTPTSTQDSGAHSLDDHTPRRHSDCGEDYGTPPYRTSDEEFSPRQTTHSRSGSPNISASEELNPRKTTHGRTASFYISSDEESSPRKSTDTRPGKISHWSEASDSDVQCSPDHERTGQNENGSDDTLSDRSPLRGKRVGRRKRRPNKRQSTGSVSEMRQNLNTKEKEQLPDNSTSNIVKTEGSFNKGGYINTVRDKSKKENDIWQPLVRTEKTQSQAYSTPDSGIFNTAGGSKTSVSPREQKSVERKRKVNNEIEKSTNIDNVKRSKHIKSETVGLVTQTLPNQSAVIKTSVPQISLPQTSTTPSNVNLKIDLALYNISGHVFPSPVTTPVISAAGDLNSSVVTQTSASHSLGPNKTDTNSARNLSQRQRPIRNIRSSTPSSSNPEAMKTSKVKAQSSAGNSVASAGKQEGAKPKPQGADNSLRRSKRKRVQTRERSSTVSPGNRDFPNSWCDDSDSESDHSWKPGSEKSETDDVLTEEEEILSDSSYEILIPKTAADLLDEYKSDDTDGSWNLADEC